MSELEAIADRVEIETLRGEFTDAVMMRDYDRVTLLFTPDGAPRIPYANVELAGRAADACSDRLADARRSDYCYHGMNYHGNIPL